MNDTHVIRLLEVVNEMTQDGIWLLDYSQRAAWRKEWGKEGKVLLPVHCPRHSIEKTNHPNELLRSNNIMLKKTIQENVSITHLTAWWLNEEISTSSEPLPSYVSQFIFWHHVPSSSHANFSSVDIPPPETSTLSLASGQEFGGGWVRGQWT